MTRTFGLTALMLTLAVVGYLYVAEARSPNQAAHDHGAQDLAVAAAADATLVAARTAVESSFATSGTYAGSTVPTGVALVSANGAAYCLQIGAGDAIRHLSGPGGSPAAGPC